MILDNPQALADRVSALNSPHLVPLNRYVEELRSRYGSVPWFDPLDGGAEARLLLLLETPGPRLPEPRFVSRDNPTATGRNLRKFLHLPRHLTAIWNAVPWVIHRPGAKNRPPRVAEVRDGLAELPSLLELFPKLQVVIAAGRVAGLAVPTLVALAPTVEVLTMPHPSPTFVNTSPAVSEEIRATMAAAAQRLGSG